MADSPKELVLGDAVEVYTCWAGGNEQSWTWFDGYEFVALEASNVALVRHMKGFSAGAYLRIARSYVRRPEPAQARASSGETWTVASMPRGWTGKDHRS